MSTIFRLDSSIRVEGSVTRAVATTLESALVANLGDTTIIRRDLGQAPLPSTVWATSVFAAYTPQDQQSPEQKQAVALATELADEMEQADAFIFALPFYNLGVSQHVKAWVDMLLTEPRFSALSPKSRETVAGRPAYLIIARGGGYGVGTPREGWDHATAWLRRIFEDVWFLDVHVIESELTLAGADPAMASLRDLGARNLQNAHSAATEHGKSLAEKLSMTGIER
ncbi:MAG: putative acyl carrier protein phosphodiesterase [Chlorobi bacterium]|nr:putative acyl carrier protein phosphodiesterase [Chlorobiota bacterium]